MTFLEAFSEIGLPFIKGASGDAILWSDGTLYFYFPPPFFCLFYISLLTQLYSFYSSTIQFLYATHAEEPYLQPP